MGPCMVGQLFGLQYQNVLRHFREAGTLCAAYVKDLVIVGLASCEVKVRLDIWRDKRFHLLHTMPRTDNIVSPAQRIPNKKRS